MAHKKRRIRSKDTCPHCNQRYETFRSSSVPCFADAYASVFQHSVEAHEAGNYSLNAYRGSVLGYMRLAKKYAWDTEHVYWCGEEAREKAAAEEAEARSRHAPF